MSDVDAPGPEPSAGGRPHRRWSRPGREVLAAMGLALVVRVATALAAPAVPRDSVGLLEAAEAVRGGGIGALLTHALPHHPLPPALIAHLPGETILDLFRAFAPLGGGPAGAAEAAGTLLAILGGTLAVWPLHALARQACGRHAATAAVLLYAALPETVAVAAVPMAEGLYVLPALGALALALAARLAPPGPRRTARLCGAGVLAGIAYLCRPEGLVIALAAGVVAVLPSRRRLLSGALVATAFLLVAAPYAVSLSRERGSLCVTPKKDLARFAGISAPQAGDARTDGRADGRQDLATALRGTAGALERSLLLPGLLLAAAGLLRGARWRRRRSILPRAVLLGTAAVFTGLVLRLQTGWGYGGGRHALGAALLLLPFAGEGAYWLGGFLSRVTSRRRLTLAVAMLVAVPAGARAVLRPPGEGQRDARRLGEALAALERGPGEGRLVIATFGEPGVAYYADPLLARQGGALDARLVGRYGRVLTAGGEPADRRAELVRTLRDTGADWLVLDLYAGAGPAGAPGRLLLARLLADGAVSLPAVGAGGPLAAFRVVPAPARSE